MASLATFLFLRQVTATLGREDSLAELENSFNEQMQSGGIPASVSEGEPPAPPPSSITLGRDDSLAQLERSFEKQVGCTDRASHRLSPIYAFREFLENIVFHVVNPISTVRSV